jgi:hypothetical protein
MPGFEFSVHTTPAWVAEGNPQGGSLSTREFQFVIKPGGGPARVRIAEIYNISNAVSLSGGDPVSLRTEFSDVVMLPQPRAWLGPVINTVFKVHFS